jgi:hypothetical protein
MLKIFKGGRKFFITGVFLVLIASILSCAAQNRHRKIKAVPCPCETQNKRLSGTIMPDIQALN